MVGTTSAVIISFSRSSRTRQGSRNKGSPRPLPPAPKPPHDVLARQRVVGGVRRRHLPTALQLGGAHQALAEIGGTVVAQAAGEDAVAGPAAGQTPARR